MMKILAEEALKLDKVLATLRLDHDPSHVYICGRVKRLGEPASSEDRTRFDKFQKYECVLGVPQTFPFHQVIDFETILAKGFTGIRRDAETAAARFELAGDAPAADLCRSVMVVCDSMCRVSARFADELDCLADVSDEPRLHDLAAIMRKVPAGPADTFNEALQTIFFTWCFYIDGFGRLDKILRKYYETDIAAGRLDRGEAKAMLVDFFRQINEQTAAPRGAVTYMNRTITLGGMDEAGRDVTNELTYLFLEVTRELRFATSPAVYLRIGERTPDRLLRSAIDVLADGVGYPSFFNDEIFVDALRAAGCTLEDARDYAPTGCGETTIPGRCTCNCAFAQLNVPLILVLALHDGRHPATGEQLGPHTGELEDLAGFEQLLDAFKTQFTYFMDIAAARADVIMEDIQLNGYMALYHNAVNRDCIATGKKFCGGGARYSFAQINLHGTPNLIDSLLMLRRLVFTGEISAAALMSALDSDFTDEGALRTRIKNAPGRWGNDNDEADSLAASLTAFMFTDISRRTNFLGGPYVPLAISFTLNHDKAGIPATPDGRVTGDPLAAVNSAVQGCDRSGLTALFNSMAKINWALAPGSVQCGIGLHPSMVRTPEDRDKLAALLKTQTARKGFSQLLCNIVDNETLLAARAEPEKYRHINVRVSGYNAYFVDLPEAVQNEIIARTKHSN